MKILNQILLMLMVTTFSCDLTEAQKDEIQTDPLKKIMHDHLKPKGKNPVHSILVCISDTNKTYCEAVGLADGKAEPVGKDYQFKISSITKTMTAIVILQMHEEKKLNINDKISDYLKDVPFVRVEELHNLNSNSYGNEITIKQLLQHRSGIGDIFTDAATKFNISVFFHKRRQFSPDKLMNRYYKYGLNNKPHFAPDSGYYYSDVNYFLLGILIEKLSKQTLAQQFKSRIFMPLGMTNSYLEYYEPPRGNGQVAHSFLGRFDMTKLVNTSYDWAGGGVMSTTTDLTKFIKGLFEMKLFQHDSTLMWMTTMPREESFYGLGLCKWNLNGDVFYGNSGIWGAIVAYCPDKKLSFSGNMNQVNPSFNPFELVESLLEKFSDTTKAVNAANKIEYDYFFKHVSFLASDELKGRDIGSEGYEMAADYVAKEFKTNGLLPFGDNGTYFQKVSLALASLKISSFNLFVENQNGNIKGTYGKNVSIFLNTRAENYNKKQELVFVGYGNIIPEMKIDDYKDIDVKGKTVIVALGGPKKKHPSFLNPLTKVNHAIHKGANGVIVFFSGKGILQGFILT